MRPHWPAIAALASLTLCGCSRDFAVPPAPGPGTVYGTVVYAIPGQSTPAPAAGASISLLGTSLSTTAGASGDFLLSGIIQSTGSLLFQVDSTGSGLFDHQRIISLSDIGAGAGRQIGLADVIVGANAQMTGRVVLGDRAGQPGGQGGTTVFVPSAQYTTTTGDDGEWTLDNLPEGPITLSVYHAAYEPQSIGPIDLASNQNFGVSDLTLAPAPGSQQTGTIGGTVAFVPALSSASGTTVQAVSATGVPITTQANSTGSFQITGLQAGLYSVVASQSGYQPASVPNVLVQSGIESVLPEIVLGTEPGADGGGLLQPDGGVVGPGEIVANAGAPGAVGIGESYTLNGSGSVDGSGGALFYTWQQTAGTPVVLSINSSVLASRPSFIAPSTPQDLAFTLIVSDAAGYSASATTEVTIALPPTALVTPSVLTLSSGESAILNGSGSSDPTNSPLTYQWTVASGGAILSTDGGPSATVTSPAASGTSQVQLVVSNGFIDSAPFDVDIVTGAPANVSVSAGPNQTVGTNSIVILTAAAQSTDPNDTFVYQWHQQDGGTAVTLVQPDTATPSFISPAQATSLSFEVTATATSGSLATGSVNVFVEDRSPPVIVQSYPTSGGQGSPLYARAVFNDALDPATITAANVAILDASGQPVPADLSYDPSTFTVDVLPHSPLPVGQSYTFSVGAVTNASGIAHVPTTFNYVIQSPPWSFWSSGYSSAEPDPGVAVNAAGPVIFGVRNEAGCGGSWILRPSDGGTLVDDPLCFGLGNETLGRKGFVVNGGAWGFLAVQNYGLVFEESSGWVEVPVTPYTIGTDGVSLMGTFEGAGMNYAVYDPTCSNSWCVEAVDPTSYVYDSYYMTVSGFAGKVAAAGSKNSGGVYNLLAFEREDAGVWDALPGAVGSLDAIASSEAEIPSRMVFANGEPFVVYAPQAGVSEISAAAWNSSTQAWTLYPNAGDGAGSIFDVVARGSTVYVAEILAAELRIRWIDLAAPAPAFQDLLGPNGLTLNTCGAGHPEAFITDDSLWVTWYESCAANSYQVFLARWGQ